MDIIEGREIDRQEWMAELLMQLGIDWLTNTSISVCLIHPVVVESQNKNCGKIETMNKSAIKTRILLNKSK